MYSKFINLNEHSINESHKVKVFNGQIVFHSQKWIIPFTSSKSKYISPYFVHPNFKIKFALVFDENGTTKLYGKMVLQNLFDSIKIYIRFGSPDGPNKNIDIYWQFQLNNISCFKSLPGFTKDIIIKNGYLDKESNLNIYIEFSYYDKKIFRLQQELQKKRSNPNINSIANGEGVGLINEKNICYMNSSLQILYHIPQFRSLLYSFHCSKDFSQKVLINIQYLFFTMENSTESCSAIPLHNSLKFCTDDAGKHKDSCEFIFALENAICKEIQGSQIEKKLNDLFQIQMVSNIECPSKSYKKSQNEYHRFLKIIVNEDDNKPVQLIDLLKNFQKKSEVTYKIEQNIELVAFKWDEFVSFPPILRINFLRFRYDVEKCSYIKSNKPVEFQETIDLSQFSNIENDIFELYAILNHAGGTDSGHYHSYIHKFESNTWYRCDDIRFEKHDINTPLINDNIMRQAYLLLYVRKSERERLFSKCVIDQETKKLMEKIIKIKENEINQKNLLTFHFVLEDEMNSPKPLDERPIISPKTLQIHNSKTNYDLYEEVAKLFDKNSDEIRLWLMNMPKGQKILKENSVYADIKCMKNDDVFFVQNKNKDENLIPYVENDKFENINYLIVFIEYFDQRMKIPIHYIGSLLIDENTKLDSAPISSMLDFPDETRFLFFNKIGPLAASKISSSETLRKAQIVQGSTIIVQVDANLTPGNKLPDLSLSKILKDVELNNSESNQQLDYNNNDDIINSSFVNNDNAINNTTNPSNIDNTTNSSNIDNTTNSSNIDNTTNSANIDNTTNSVNIDNTTNSVNIDNTTNSANIDNTTNSVNIDNTTNSVNIDNTTNSVNIDNTTNSVNIDNTTNSVNIDNTTNSVNIDNTTNSVNIDNTTNSVNIDNTTNSVNNGTNNSSVRNYNAVDFFTDKNKDYLDNYLALKYNMNHFYISNYEDQSHVVFTLDFPSSYSLNDMKEIIKRIDKLGKVESIWLFEKMVNTDEAAVNYIPAVRFTTKLYEKSFFDNKIYYFYTPEITNFSGKSIYDVQIAADGYNVTFSKFIVGKKVTNPAEILIDVSKVEGFPDLEIPEVVKKVAERNEHKPENTTPDKTHFLIFEINKSKILGTMMMNDSLHLTYHSILFCKFIPPENDEVLVKVSHVIVNEKNEFDFIKIPFCMNLKKNSTVKDFKDKVLKCVKIDDKDEFLKAKLIVFESRSKIHPIENDLLLNLTNESNIYIIYNRH